MAKNNQPKDIQTPMRVDLSRGIIKKGGRNTGSSESKPDVKPVGQAPKAKKTSKS